MRSHVRVAVIGGGVVGCSVLYHLTKLGWRDVVLLERDELTSGSSWHAAGGMHTLNSDPNVAKLQDYTIRLYREIEEISGQSCGIHLTGGIMLAGTPERLDFLKTAHARGKVLGLDSEFISIEEAKRRHPLIEAGQFVGALFDPYEGHVDPAGVTHAYARAARLGGAEIYRKTPVIELVPEADGGWRVITPAGSIKAEAVVNAAGLWAREVGRLVGLELPVLAMAHHYLVTEDMPEVAGAGRRAAALHRLRGRDLPAPGRPGPAARDVREGLPALGRAHHARRLQPRAARARPRPHRAEPGGRFPALPGGRPRRHQARDQRPVHLRAGRQSPGRTRAGAAQLLPRVRGHGRFLAGRRRRPRARELDGRGRPRHGRVRHGRGALWRLRHPGLHQRQGARALQPAFLDHLSERGAAGGTAAENHADLRSPEGEGRGVRRRLRPRACAVVRARRRAAERDPDLSPLQCPRAGRARMPRRARRRRPPGDRELRQARGHGSGRRSLAGPDPRRPPAGAGPA